MHVISDMEGVAGIVKWQQVGGGEAMYEEGRRLYTGEINAAVRGAKAAGATEIVVMDCHGAGEGWTFNSLIPDELDPTASTSCRTRTEYTEFLEEGCDAALFVGMHARAGHVQRCHEPHDPAGTTRTSGSTARSSARPGSMRRSAGTGAARFSS